MAAQVKIGSGGAIKGSVAATQGKSSHASHAAAAIAILPADFVIHKFHFCPKGGRTYIIITKNNFLFFNTLRMLHARIQHHSTHPQRMPLTVIVVVLVIFGLL